MGAAGDYLGKVGWRSCAAVRSMELLGMQQHVAHRRMQEADLLRGDVAAAPKKPPARMRGSSIVQLPMHVLGPNGGRRCAGLAAQRATLGNPFAGGIQLLKLG